MYDNILFEIDHQSSRFLTMKIIFKLLEHFVIIFIDYYSINVQQIFGFYFSEVNYFCTISRTRELISGFNTNIHTNPDFLRYQRS